MIKRICEKIINSLGNISEWENKRFLNVGDLQLALLCKVAKNDSASSKKLKSMIFQLFLEEMIGHSIS